MKCGAWRVQCEVWRKQWEVRSVKCGMWSVKCGAWTFKFGVRRAQCEVWSVKCEVWSVKEAVRSEKCGLWSVKRGVWSVKCAWSVKFEVWSAKSAVWSVECGVWRLCFVSRWKKRLSREGHGRDRLSLNYRSFIFGKLPPPACPGLCYCYLQDSWVENIKRQVLMPTADTSFNTEENLWGAQGGCRRRYPQAT